MAACCASAGGAPPPPPGGGRGSGGPRGGGVLSPPAGPSAAAFTAPAGLSIITTTFAEGPARNRALGIYTATGASGFSLGLVLGGVLTTAGWRWTFLLPFPIAAVLLVAAWRVIRPDPPLAQREGRFDVAGAVSVTGAMLALVFGISGAPDAGWASVQTVVSLAVAVALLAAF